MNWFSHFRRRRDWFLCVWLYVEAQWDKTTGQPQRQAGDAWTFERELQIFLTLTAANPKDESVRAGKQTRDEQSQASERWREKDRNTAFVLAHISNTNEFTSSCGTRQPPGKAGIIAVLTILVTCVKTNMILMSISAATHHQSRQN